MIAIISDIHGNNIALSAVLGELSRLGVENSYVLGISAAITLRSMSVVKLCAQETYFLSWEIMIGISYLIRIAPDLAAQIVV